MTVAELKRKLTVGTVLTCVHNYKGIQKAKRIVVTNSSGNVGMKGDGLSEDRPSYLSWPKAKELTETPKGFKITPVNGDGRFIEYEWGYSEVA